MAKDPPQMSWHSGHKIIPSSKVIANKGGNLANVKSSAKRKSNKNALESSSNLKTDGSQSSHVKARQQKHCRAVSQSRSTSSHVNNDAEVVDNVASEDCSGKEETVLESKFELDKDEDEYEEDKDMDSSGKESRNSSDDPSIVDVTEKCKKMKKSSQHIDTYIQWIQYSPEPLGPTQMLCYSEPQL